MRADQLLVDRGLAATRSQAQRLIAAGVQWHAPQGWRRVSKNGEELPEDAAIELLDDAEARWVSRGGLKLEGALAHTGLSVAGRHCLDVGQSTGGFTQVLLAHDAASVLGIDVGHGQLHPQIRADARVRALEGVHVRDLATAIADPARAGGFELVVADLSFISLISSLAYIAPWIAPGADALLLLKPQFEVGREHVGKGGIVKDEAQVARIRAEMHRACEHQSLQLRDDFESPVRGGDGNREYFVWATRAR